MEPERRSQKKRRSQRKPERRSQKKRRSQRKPERRSQKKRRSQRKPERRSQKKRRSQRKPERRSQKKRPERSQRGNGRIYKSLKKFFSKLSRRKTPTAARETRVSPVSTVSPVSWISSLPPMSPLEESLRKTKIDMISPKNLQVEWEKYIETDYFDKPRKKITRMRSEPTLYYPDEIGDLRESRKSLSLEPKKHTVKISHAKPAKQTKTTMRIPQEVGYTPGYIPKIISVSKPKTQRQNKKGEQI